MKTDAQVVNPAFQSADKVRAKAGIFYTFSKMSLEGTLYLDISKLRMIKIMDNFI